MKFITILALILATVQLSAQIQIDSTDILTDIGTSWITLSYNDSLNVTLGDSGGPHTWDFTSLASQLNDTSFYNIIDPLTAPLHDSFPDANLVKMRTDHNSDSSYEYIEITDIYYRLLGIQQNIFGITSTVKLDSSTMYFPFAYGFSSSLYAFDTIINSPDTFITAELNRDMSIDAYGTVIIPQGSFPCLRIRSHTSIHISGYIVIVVPFPIDTTISEYSYNWLTESQPDLITISSPLNETNPNFTVAGKVEMFHDYSTGTDEVGINLDSLAVKIIHENNNYYLDFKDITSFSLKIYDLTGRVITNRGFSGTGRIQLNIENPGIYFVKIRNSDYNFITKINILR